MLSLYLKKGKFLFFLSSFLFVCVIYATPLNHHSFTKPFQNSSTVSFKLPVVGSIPTEILKTSLTHNSLWEQVAEQWKAPNVYYVLKHGPTSNQNQSLSIDGKEVRFIDKHELPSIGNSPYFMFHTLNIASETALVRVYITFIEDQVTKSEHASLFFNKTGGVWTLTKVND
jgi:hypothetical protein